MIRGVIVGLAVLVLHAAAAEPFTRILWYNIESPSERVQSGDAIGHDSTDQGVVFHLAAGERAFFDVDASPWWRLRVYHDEAHRLPGVWSSAGDGVFISHKPLDAHHHDEFTDYFYQVTSPGARVLLLENDHGSGLAVSLHYSASEALPEHVQDAQVKQSAQFNGSGTSTTLKRQSGFESHDFQRLGADQIYPTKFSEPGLYHLEIKVPWHGAYQFRELVTMKASHFDRNDRQAADKEFQLAAQLDSGTLYEDTATRQIQLLSRSILVPFYLEAADQQIHIDLDRNAYVRWLESDVEDQFLFSRNGPGAIEQARHKALAFEPRPPVTTTFYRSLPPNRPMETEAFIAVTGGLSEPRDTFLPHPVGQPAEPDYFYQLAGNRDATFNLPRQTQSPPVRLSFKWPDKDVLLAVRSSAGEEQRIRYLPDFTIAEHWQLDNASFQKLAASPGLKRGQPPYLVTETMLAFNQPFQSVSVHNLGEHAAWFRLDYQNEQRMAPSMQVWLNRAGDPASDELIQALITGNTPGLADNPLTHEVASEWHARLLARAQQFAERYPSQQVAGQRAIGQREFQQIKNSLAGAFDVELNTLADVYQHLMAQGYNFTARQLLVDFAVADAAPLQQEAETLLLQMFADQERWFDVEGYWAWRLFNKAAGDALAGIARSWAYQNRYAESAQLFWLTTGKWYQPPTLSNSLSHPLWVKLQPEFDGQTRQALIYNQGLEQYLSTFYLADAMPLSAELSPAQRLKVTLYPVLTETSAEDAPLKEFSVTINEQRHRLAVRLDRASDSLVWAQDNAHQVGLPQSFIFELEPGQENTLAFTTHGFDAGVVIEATDASPSATPDLTLRLSELVLAQQQGQITDEQLKRIKADTLHAVLTDEQQHLLGQLTASYGWQRLDTVGSSNGIAYLEAPQWRPSSPGLQLRNALMLSPVREGERRLDNDEQAQIEIELRDAMRLSLQVRKADEITVPAAPVRVRVTTPKGQQLLTLNGQGHSLTLELPPGHHVIGLEFAEPSDAIVLYRLQTADGEPALPPAQIKTYRASQNQPIKLFVPANSLLRTDHYQHRDDSATHSYQWFAEDTFHTVAHTASGEHSYYRFYLWQQQPLVEESQQIAVLPPASAPDVKPELTIWPLQPKQSVYADTRYDLNGQEDGTWGFDAGYRVRSNFDEGAGTPQEKFIDTGWNYRLRMDDRDAFWNSSIHWREHNGNGLQTLVSDNQLYWLPNKYFDVEANLNLYYQAGADDEEIEGAWSAYGSVSGRWKYFWNNRTRNEVELQLFARELSEKQMVALPVDDDILTQYKLDHSYGMRLSDRFYYQPWLDSRIHAGAQVTLNEFGNGKLIDKWAVETGWRQYWRPWRLAFDARYTRYMADAHRASGLSSTLFGLSLDYELWQSKGNLWQFSFDLRHDINRNATGAFFGISWNHTDGQGYNDFAPKDQIFSSLRQRHALQVIQTNDIVTSGDTEAPDED